MSERAGPSAGAAGRGEVASGTCLEPGRPGRRLPAPVRCVAEGVGEVKVLHIGKRAPKGWVELPGAIHLGKGIWLMRIEKEASGGKGEEK